MKTRDGDRVIPFSNERRDPVCSEDDARLLEHLIQRVQAEFLTMPGLRLTVQQARRFWGLEEELCDAILSTLVEARFLRLTRDGAFARNDGTSA